MSKEIINILSAFNEAKANGRQTALATVVHVEGSSYRRPGARMLVEDNGNMTGAISGGCLEGDALKKALLAINQQQNKLVTYDTQHEDDVELGVQLGCNGIVNILFEPIDPLQPDNPIAILERSLVQRKDMVVVTLFSLKNFNANHPGTCFSLDRNNLHSRMEDNELEKLIKQDAQDVLSHKDSFLQQYHEHELLGFVELIRPPICLVMVGAGNDALPLSAMASLMGWQSIVIDGRQTHANKQRFPNADRILVGDPAVTANQLNIDERCFFILMTHNYNYDLAMLKLLLQENCTYIGTLGPQKRLQRMLADLAQDGLKVSPEQMTKIFGPTGLDIGAETSEEIALSVLAEILAVQTGRDGSFLKDRTDYIHARGRLETTDHRKN
ncbi:MAG TPA: XdhC/CoxI family protein [Chitinophagaceae bacterium]|nr:XdhC/CoxI family protein [Chitinophagaceae bacterium]